MPVFDTPITTDDTNLKKVLAQNLPVVLYLYDSRQGPNKPLEDALSKIARKQSGELLIARVDVAANTRTHAEYDHIATPAIITLTKGWMGRKVRSQVANVRPADVRAYVDYLLERGPEPSAAPAPQPSANGTGAGRSGIQHATDTDFRNVVLKSKMPVLVDFWAPWCGPCLALAPVIEELAKTYAGRIRVVKVNTDENPRLSHQYQIRSIPTLVMFKGGQPIERRSGANRAILRDMIEEALRN